jgi:hypothetical protein
MTRKSVHVQYKHNGCFNTRIILKRIIKASEVVHFLVLFTLGPCTLSPSLSKLYKISLRRAKTTNGGQCKEEKRIFSL